MRVSPVREAGEEAEADGRTDTDPVFAVVRGVYVRCGVLQKLERRKEVMKTHERIRVAVCYFISAGVVLIFRCSLW